jgi:hypothetical protein
MLHDVATVIYVSQHVGGHHLNFDMLISCHIRCCSQDEAERDTLREIISNSKLSEHFLALARDLDVMEPKVPEDVYKTHLTGAKTFLIKA